MWEVRALGAILTKRWKKFMANSWLEDSNGERHGLEPLSSTQARKNTMDNSYLQVLASARIKIEQLPQRFHMTWQTNSKVSRVCHFCGICRLRWDSATRPPWMLNSSSPSNGWCYTNGKHQLLMESRSSMMATWTSVDAPKNLLWRMDWL